MLLLCCIENNYKIKIKIIHIRHNTLHAYLVLKYKKIFLVLTV